MKTVQGDLLKLAMDGKFDVIVHGCNCFCTMGAGIAKTIKQKFPEAFEADLKTVSGDRDKLGTVSTALIVRGNISFEIVNAYTQFNWRGPGTKAEYTAIADAFAEVKRMYSGKRIGYPAIGAGLARGNWTLIASLIDKHLEGEDHTFVEFVR